MIRTTSARMNSNLPLSSRLPERAALSRAVAPPRRQPRAADLPHLDREALYAEFAPLVKRLLRQYGQEAEFRQDLASEIYYRFCLLVEAYDPQRGVPFRPYIVRQLTATIYTFVRQQWTLHKREICQDWSAAESPGEPQHDPTSSWIAALSQEQILQSLPAAIARLPERQRQVVLWRYYEELPFEEIAGLLSIEASSVRSLLRHGLNNLRKQMQSTDCDPDAF